jgi:hypothetical protein
MPACLPAAAEEVPEKNGAQSAKKRNVEVLLGIRE